MDQGDLAAALQLHTRMSNPNTQFRKAGHTCAKCTLKHGTYIKPDFTFGNRTSFEELEHGRYPICAAGDQCVGNSYDDAFGCCQQCNDNQFCVSGTLSYGGERDAEEWNLCPPGYLCNSFAARVINYIEKCAPGTICQNNERLDCREVRQSAIDAGMGDIHAGSYCPDGGLMMHFCPQGYYCNSTDMSRKFVCPAGYFCPLKTETPYIKCSGCKEGALELRTDPLLVFGIASPLIFIAIYIIIIRYRPDFFASRIRSMKGTKKQYCEAKHELAAKHELQALRMQESLNKGIINEDSKRCHLNEARILSMITSIERRVTRMSSISSSILDSNHNNFDLESNYSEETKLTTEPSFFEAICKRWGKNNDKDTAVFSGNFPPNDEEAPSRDEIYPIPPSMRSFTSIEFDADLVFRKLDVNNDGVLSYDELNAILSLNEIKLRYFVRKMNKLDGKPLDTPTISKDCFTKYFYETLLNTESFDPDNSEAAEIFDALDTNSDGIIQGMELHSSILENILTDRQIHLMMKKMVKNNDSGRVSIDKETFIKLYPMLLSEVILEETTSGDAGVDITFSDLSLEVNIGGKNVNILDSMCGRIQGRAMTALMGGSGTGKTSLLNALCGKAYYGKVTGTILINGTEANIEDHKHLIGFVPQDDIMYAELTVKENLMYAGRLKLPSSTSITEISELADDIIVNLGLIKVRDRIVGDIRRRGISGGEKKRVNIGLELMGKPRILFLDEPTSGLDASSSSLVMSSLKSLVRDDGVTVVSVIHQPRKFIFELIDNVILLGMGGRIVYHGRPSSAQSYFQSLGYVLPPGENIADWLLDISSGQMGVPSQALNDEKSFCTLMTGDNLRDNREYLFQQWENHLLSLPESELEMSLLPPEPAPIPPKLGKPTFFAQVWAQTQRNFIVIYRNTYTKLFDTFIIVMAAASISLLDGSAILVYPSIANGGPVGLPLSEISLEYAWNLPLSFMFYPFYRAAMFTSGDAIKIAVITGVLVALNATKVMSEKKIEFTREASSGYSVSAYFIAVNITATLEHSFQMMLAGIINLLLRSTVSSWGAHILNFVSLGWGAVSWALFFSVIIPPKNLVLVTGFFMAFFSILFSGALGPFFFKEIYQSNVLQLITGLFSPARFFVETFSVSDFRCMPPQTGFTITPDAVSISNSQLSFDIANYGVRDEHLVERSCDGWFKYYPASFCVGLTVRLAAGALIYFIYSSQFRQRSIKSLENKKFVYTIVLYVTFFVFMFLMSVYFIFN